LREENGMALGRDSVEDLYPEEIGTQVTI